MNVDYKQTLMQCWNLGVLLLVASNHAWRDHRAEWPQHRCFHPRLIVSMHHHHRTRLHFFLWQWIPLVHDRTTGRPEGREGESGESVRASRL